MKNNACKRISIDPPAVEKLSRGQELSQSIHLVVERCQDYDKKQLKILTDKLGVKELSRLFKNSFSRREKHRYECNQVSNSTKDLNNILSFQKHLSTRKMISTKIPKHLNSH